MAIQEDLRSIALDDPSGLGDATLGEMPRMRVRKRDGSLDAIDLNKIVARVERCADGLDAVDPMRVALRTISGLVDGSTTEELDHLAVRTAAALILRPTHRVRPLPAAPPDPPQGHRDPQILLHARRLRPRPQPERGDRVLQPDLLARVPAVQPHAVQQRAPSTARCRPATCLESPEGRALEGIYKRYTDIARLSKYAGGIGVAWHRIRARGSLIKGTNGQSNGIVPLAQDPRRQRGGGQPGRSPQGRLLRLPRELARRHRGVPRAARQHRRRGPAHPQPQPRQLGARPVHEAGGGRRRLVAVRPQGGARAGRSLRRRVRAAYAEAERQGAYRAPGSGPRALRPHDAHLGPDRQRLDDLQGRLQQEVQPDRHLPGAVVHSSNLCTEILEVTNQARPRCATSARSTSRGSWAEHGAFDFDASRLGPWWLCAVPRPRHRHQLLPHRRGRNSNQRWRPVGWA
jgi:hypothetical protein